MIRLARPVKLWQRNVLATALVLVALTTLWITDMRTAWSGYRDSVVPEHVVPKGEALTVDGVTWRVDSVRHLNRVGRRNAPPGTVINVITIEREGAEPGGCEGVLTDGTRRWRAEFLDYEATAPDGVTTTCGMPGPVQFSFLLPDDAVPTAVDIIEMLGPGRITMRLEL